MELRLVGKQHRPLHRKGQAGLFHKLRPKAQVTGSVPFFFQGGGIVAGVEVGGEVLQMAGDVLLGDDVSEIGHRLTSGTGVAEGVLGAEAVNELIHNIARILIRFNVCDAAVNIQTQRGGIDVAFRDMRLYLHVHGAFLHGVLGRFAFHHGYGFV